MWTIAILALVVAFAALLFVPADVSLQVERRRRFKTKLRFHWLFIQVERDLGSTRPNLNADSRLRPRRPHGIPLRTLTAAGKVPGLWASGQRLVAGLARSVRILRLSARIQFGTGDPSDTGRLCGLASPLLLWCNQRPGFDMCLLPDFSNSGLTGALGATLRLHPARFAYGVGSAVLSITTVRLLAAVIGSRPWKR